MVKIKELENYYNKTFKELVNDNDIIEIANDIDTLWKDYQKWELENSFDVTDTNDYLQAIKKDFYKWVENCNGTDLLDYEIQTYQRHFKLENGKYYYLNSYI